MPKYEIETNEEIANFYEGVFCLIRLHEEKSHLCFLVPGLNMLKVDLKKQVDYKDGKPSIL